jgi:hypothetical protein
MITSTLVTATSVSVPSLVFTSTTTGLAGGTEQQSAVTTIALCNTAAITLTDETSNQVNVNVYFAKKGIGAQTANLVVANLTIPAGETVFFSEERIVLDGGDEIYVGTSSASKIAVTVSSLAV